MLGRQQLRFPNCRIHHRSDLRSLATLDGAFSKQLSGCREGQAGRENGGDSVHVEHSSESDVNDRLAPRIYFPG